MPGLARPADRTNSALAAHRSRAASAVSRSPCTVTERTRVRPLTGTGPTRPALPTHRGAAVAATRHLETHPMPHDTNMPSTGAGPSCSALTCVVGWSLGCDLASRSPEATKNTAVQRIWGARPEGFEPPTF